MSSDVPGDPRTGTVRRILRIKYLIPIILLVLGLFTRFYNINVQVLDMDEGATYFFSRMSIMEIIDYGEPNSPLFYKLEGWMCDIFGNTELSIKFLPALFGAFCIPFTYLASKELTGNESCALISASLVLLSPVMISYAQDARGFSCAAAMVMAQLWLFSVYLNREDSRPLWIAFSVVSAIGVHMHYVAMMPTAILFLYAYIHQRRKSLDRIVRSNTSLSLIVFVILILPIIPSIHNALRASMGYDDTWISGLDYVKECAVAFFFDNETLAIAMSVLLLIGAAFSVYRFRWKGMLLLSVAAIPFLFTLWVSTFSHIHYRYVLFAAPILYMLIASPLCALEDVRIPHRTVVAAACTVLCIVLVACASFPALEDQYANPQRGDFKGAVNILEEQASEGDYIIYSPEWIEWGIGGCLDFYYDNDKAGTTIIGADSVSVIDGIRHDHPDKGIFIMTWADSTELIDWAKSGTETTVLYQNSGLTLYRLV